MRVRAKARNSTTSLAFLVERRLDTVDIGHLAVGERRRHGDAVPREVLVEIVVLAEREGAWVDIQLFVELRLASGESAS